MKVRIKSGKPRFHLTKDKIYDAEKAKNFDFFIVDDCGYRLGIFKGKCTFLDGGSWEIIKE